MKYDYTNLNRELHKKHISKTQLSEKLGLSTRTVAKISKGEILSKSTIEKIAEYLNCEPDVLYRGVSENSLLQILRDEKNGGISGGIYHEFQIRMTYNSNHMEGSTLSEEQTRMIFETRTIDSQDGILIDDIIETEHHFRAIDYCIEHAEDQLTQEMIKKLHYILKHDTKDSLLPWFAVGDYKTRPNSVGGKETADPSEVPMKMKELLDSYQSLSVVRFEDIVDFHAKFESIHPFQDGNGRVGRLIAFKECLKNNVTPFIIEDRKKAFYYRGLSNWNSEKGWLLDTCLDGQDSVNKLLNRFEITEYRLK